MNKALFLDRDGTICQMVQYDYGWDSPQHPDAVKLNDDIIEIIKLAQEKNLKVIEISNQPVVAKGKITQQISDQIEKKVHDLLLENGVKIDDSYISPHHPQGKIPELSIDCDCRKPKPGLLLKAAKNHNIDLKTSLFLGDKASDALAAYAVGCKSIILLHDNDEPQKVLEARNAKSDYKVTDLSQVLEIIHQF